MTIAAVREVRVAAGVATTLLALAFGAADAQAHAVLEETAPARGATVREPPPRVEFGFNESVETSFGAVRVYDAAGEEVQEGDPYRPGGDGSRIAVDLPADLADGSYTAAYRVISADSHPVSGGFVFSVGRPGESAAVSDVLDDEGRDSGTDAVFAAARAASYLAIALAAGGSIFLLWSWRPALARTAGEGREWAEARGRFAARARRLGWIAIAAGIAGTVVGLVAQGATASGSSLIDAVDPDVLSDVASTRFGTVWLIRLGIWCALGALLALVLRRGAATAAPRGLVIATVALLVALLLTPALSGHASTLGDTAVLVPANFAHVLAMSAWVGGLVLLLAALPAATSALEKADRTRLLSATLERFSALALVSVAVLLASGILQSLLELESLSALTDTWFGRLILIKAGLLALLIALGGFNRRRSVPRLLALVAGGAPPGRAGILLRRALRAEVALVTAAIVAASLLVAESPVGASAGPAAGSVEIGAARLDYTVDPAEVGENEIHLYLTEPQTGEPYEVKDAEVSATLEDPQIGPLELDAKRAGPGHFTVPDAALGVAGNWTVTIRAPVSQFEDLNGEFEVEIG